MDYFISSQVDPRLDSVYYTVRWSHIKLADKYDIARSVPAVGGIAEIFYKDREGKLNLFCIQRSWYGGIRALLRERCDASVEKDPWRLSILVKWRERIYYRWTNSESLADMQDVLFYLIEGVMPGKGPEASHRYSEIYVKEVDADKIVTI